MKKSTMFVKAHKIAKRINEKVGNYMIAFSIALKAVWKLIQAGRKRIPESTIRYTTYDLTHKEYTGPRYICGVPDWILDLNLDEADNRAVRRCAYDANVKRETEKAVLIQFVTDFGPLFTWCPKSVFKGTGFNN